MTEAVKNITYRPPVTGTTSDNPTYISGGDGSVVSEGGNTALVTADMTTRQLLEGILTELRKLNLRQEEVFEEIVNDEDILCE